MIVAAAKRDGIEWVFIDTPPNLFAVVDDAIKNRHTMVSFRRVPAYSTPARGAGNDPELPFRHVQALCGRDQRRARTTGRRRKPHRHHRARSPGEIPCAGVERADHQPRRSADGPRPRRRRAREYYAEGAGAAAEIGRLWAAIERSIKAIRGSASASGAMHKQAA